MQTSRLKVLSALFLILISFTSYALADGGVMPTIVMEKEISLPSQKAVIIWDGENETLILQTMIKGKVLEGLAWVIPIQSKTKPEVNKSNAQIFKALPYVFGEIKYPSKNVEIFLGFVLATTGFFSILMIVTFIKRKDKELLKLLCFLFGSLFILVGFFSLYVSIIRAALIFVILTMLFFFLGAYGMILGRKGDGLLGYVISSELILLFLILITFPILFSFLPGGIFFSTMTSEKPSITPIEIIEMKKIDFYDIVILKATNATYMVDWLNQNGFHISESNIPILQAYCDMPNFYFVVNRISRGDLPKHNIDVIQQEFENGTATPLEIRFSPDKPFYPLRMSSINSGRTRIDVFFFSFDQYYEEEKNILSLRKKVDFFESYSAIRRTISDPWVEMALDDLSMRFHYLIENVKATWLSYEGPLDSLKEDAYFVGTK